MKATQITIHINKYAKQLYFSTRNTTQVFEDDLVFMDNVRANPPIKHRYKPA